MASCQQRATALCHLNITFSLTFTHQAPPHTSLNTRSVSSPHTAPWLNHWFTHTLCILYSVLFLNAAQCSTKLGWNVKHDVFACNCDVLFQMHCFARSHTVIYFVFAVICLEMSWEKNVRSECFQIVHVALEIQTFWSIFSGIAFHS